MAGTSLYTRAPARCPRNALVWTSIGQFLERGTDSHWLSTWAYIPTYPSIPKIFKHPVLVYHRGSQNSEVPMEEPSVLSWKPLMLGNQNLFSKEPEPTVLWFCKYLKNQNWQFFKNSKNWETHTGLNFELTRWGGSEVRFLLKGSPKKTLTSLPSLCYLGWVQV